MRDAGGQLADSVLRAPTNGVMKTREMTSFESLTALEENEHRSLEKKTVSPKESLTDEVFRRNGSESTSSVSSLNDLAYSNIQYLHDD